MVKGGVCKWMVKGGRSGGIHMTVSQLSMGICVKGAHADVMNICSCSIDDMMVVDVYWWWAQKLGLLGIRPPFLQGPKSQNLLKLRHISQKISPVEFLRKVERKRRQT